jgi:hypothetical protein
LCRNDDYDVGSAQVGNAYVKILALRFQALPDEITACHSSLGGEFGVWIDVVKDAIGRSKERPSQATGYGTGCAARAQLASLTESTPPRRECPPLNEWRNPTLSVGSNPDLYSL